MFARSISYGRIVAGIRCFSNVEVPLTAKYYNVKRGDYSSVSHVFCVWVCAWVIINVTTLNMFCFISQSIHLPVAMHFLCMCLYYNAVDINNCLEQSVLLCAS